MRFVICELWLWDIVAHLKDSDIFPWTTLDGLGLHMVFTILHKFSLFMFKPLLQLLEPLFLRTTSTIRIDCWWWLHSSQYQPWRWLQLRKKLAEEREKKPWNQAIVKLSRELQKGNILWCLFDPMHVILMMYDEKEICDYALCLFSVLRFVSFQPPMYIYVLVNATSWKKVLTSFDTKVVNIYKYLFIYI